MPLIHRGARRWRRGHRGEDPSSLSAADRRADLGARAAYIVAIWDALF